MVAVAGVLLLLAGGAPGVKAAPPLDGPLMVTPAFPAEVGVGDLLVPATLTLTSSALLAVAVTAVTVDSGELQLSPAAFGTGVACPGAVFLIVPSGRSGVSVLLPSYPIVLAPLADRLNASCTIQLTFSVTRLPVGPDVDVTATLTGSAVPGIFQTDSGTVTIRVRRTPVAVAVKAGSTTAAKGRPIRATATLARGASSPLLPQPTGSVSFSLFGPDVASCRGQPLQTSAEQPLSVGPIRSPAFRPTLTGTYQWLARYSGDLYHTAASSPCEATTVVIDPARATPAPAPTTTTTTSAEAPTTSAPQLAPTPPDPTATRPATTTASAAPQPRRRTSARTELAAYQPAAHAEEVVALQVSAFALLALVGAARARGRSDPAADEAREAGEVGFTEIERADEGLAAVAGAAVLLRPGDRSWTWRSPGTRQLDRISRLGPGAVAARSPLLARVLNDAGYLRAILGVLSALLPAIGVVLGGVAVANVNGEALPPSFGIVVALAVLGVFDALSGLVGVTVFIIGVALAGGLSSPDEARTLMGLATLWFAAPLIAGTARPLRRPPTLTFDEHFDRTADVVIASLVGAWAVQKILQGLPGLAGVELPIAGQAGSAALIVLGALALRMGIETIAAHWYPRRLARVQPAGLPEAGTGQRLVASILILAVFVFVAVPYLGSCWQLYVGGALFITPKLLQLVPDRLPSTPRVLAAVPQGIVQTFLLLVVGVTLVRLVLGDLAQGRELIRISFVVLALPGFVVAVLELLGRDGPEREFRWYEQLLGIPILAVGALIAAGAVE